jgi:beta-galactosidase
MLLAAQYYRPPFPNKRYWEEDLDGMKAAGLNALQLWACWGWIEPEPGKFVFDDYDALMEGARRRGLKVVISTLSEITPFWTPRLYPDATMIGQQNQPIRSTLRQECNVGLTPGGCTDHAGLREAMCRFLREIAARYQGADNLVGWDCWNELRWMVNADAYVCFCPNTLAAYRAFLGRRYGDLEGLNRAWQRRYVSWEDVYPPKAPGGEGYAIPLYTDTFAWAEFLTWRAAETCRWRYQALRAGDPQHPILAHCAAPTPMPRGRGYEPPTARGNDWFNADQLEGYGSSHFPNWGGSEFSDEDIGIRIECVRSAAGGKVHWLSELQGGQSNIGLTFGSPVTGAQQQRWVWNGYARGAKAIIFWCWRDEVFSAESSGFGIIGHDGHTEERLKYMRRTSDILSKYGALLEAYQPDPAPVGLLFTPQTPVVDWSVYGQTTKLGAAFMRYARALEQLGIPYEVIESRHLDGLDRVKLLIMPAAVTVSPEEERRLLDYVAAGGKIFFESWTQAWNEEGVFAYTGKDRPFVNALGLREKYRRHVGESGGWSGKWNMGVPTGWAMTPWEYGKGTVLAVDGEGEPLLVEVPYGAGRAYALGTWAAFSEEGGPDLANFVAALCREADVLPDILVDVHDDEVKIIWRAGAAEGHRFLFLMNAVPNKTRRVMVSLPAGQQVSERWLELWSGKAVAMRKAGARLECEIELPAGEIAILLSQ